MTPHLRRVAVLAVATRRTGSSSFDRGGKELATYWSRRFSRTFTCVSRTLYLAHLDLSVVRSVGPTRISPLHSCAGGFSVASHPLITQDARTG